MRKVCYQARDAKQNPEHIYKYRFFELAVEAVDVDKAKEQDAELDPVRYKNYSNFVLP